MGVMRKLLDVPAPPPGTPGLFAFADPEVLRQALEAAAFTGVVIEPVEVTMAQFDSPQAYFAYIREIAGPIATLYGRLTPEQRELVEAEVAKATAGPDGRVLLEGVTWVAAATA